MPRRLPFPIQLPVFVCLLALSACKTDCHENGNCPPEHYRFELGEARDYLWAAPGSYWIYRNTQTGELDTQTCTGAKTYWVNDHGSTKYSRHITIDYEVLSRSISSTFNNWSYVDKTSFYNPDALRPQKTFLDRNVYGEGINNPFWYPIQKNDVGGISSSVTKCINTDTNIVINGHQFEHVVVFEIDRDDIWERKLGCIRTNTKYYWVKNVGLIKKDMIRCNYSWELMDYNIIP